MRFDDAVRETPYVKSAFKQGLQALSNTHRSCVRPRNTSLLRGSINPDEALRESHPNDPRWDYGVGFSGNSGNDKAIWIEFHPASSSHVDDVLAKHEWLRNWLRIRAPRPEQLTPKRGAFKWVATGCVALRPGSPQRHKVTAAGVHFCGKHLCI